MFKVKSLILPSALLAIFVLLTGCGQHAVQPQSQSPPANTSNNTATTSLHNNAVMAFIQKEQPKIRTINKGFIDEANLFKKVSTKQMTYKAFRASYQQAQSKIQTEVNAIANAQVASGAASYQQQYVSLLKEGLKVFAAQEQAILPNRTVNPKKIVAVQQELNHFVTDSQQLATKFGVK